MSVIRDSASFRDPSGFVFADGDTIYRQVNRCFAAEYDAFLQCGLYDDLVEKGWLIAHESCAHAGLTDEAYRVIRPEPIPFVSYPYEWCLGQLRDAALLTLRCMRRALDFDMILKDATAYNVQFQSGQPIWIDTLSFVPYCEGMPWVAYGQFCRHFLAPLLLMIHVDCRLSSLLRCYIDGIPLDMASAILARKGGLLAAQHIHLHARAIGRYGQAGHGGKSAQAPAIKKARLIALIDSLIRAIEPLALRGVATEWGSYYGNTNYSDAAATHKSDLIRAYAERVCPRTVWDLGANDGRYSRIAMQAVGCSVVAFDIDPVAVERNYNAVKADGENLLPLMLDLTNPSPSIGFANRERRDIMDRATPDCVMMLALIHHLAIANNIPLALLCEWTAALTSHVIIEFVPKEDAQVQTLLATRMDIFPDYNVEGFEAAFSTRFEVLDKQPIADSVRTLYLLKRIEGD